MPAPTTDYKLHGTMFSLYTAKARAYLQYKRLPYTEVMDHGDFRARIMPVVHKFMIPVVEGPDGKVYQDTTDILDQLEAKHPERPIVPDDPVLMMLSRLIEIFTDEVATPLAMHYRWNYPQSNAFIVEEFSNMMIPTVGHEAAPEMGKGVAAQMQSYLLALGVASKEGQALAVTLFESVARALDSHLTRSNFVFGDHPSHADFSLFLCFFAHQYRDLGPAQAFLKEHTHFLSYYLDKLQSGAGCSSNGALGITDSSIEFLKSIGPITNEFGLQVLEIAKKETAGAQSGDMVENLSGEITLTIDGKPFVRHGRTYSAWKVNRFLEAYQALSDADTSRADEILKAIGAHDLAQAEPVSRLVKRDYQVVCN